MPEYKPCPKCRSMSPPKDSEGDNLVVYPKGLQWCHRHGIVGLQRDFFNSEYQGKGEEINLPTVKLTGLQDDPHDFGLVWLAKYDITPFYYPAYGIKFIHKGTYEIEGDKVIKLKNAIYVPLQPEGSFLLRCDPAYSDIKVLNSKQPGYMLTGVKGTRLLKKLVITEDWASAIKVNRVGCMGFSLNGTKIKSSYKPILRELINSVDVTYIHLDNDEAGREGAKKIIDELGNLGYNLKTVLTEHDPKACTIQELCAAYEPNATK